MPARVTALVVAALLIMAEAVHAGPVRFKVALGGDAALGSSTSVSLWLKVADGLPPIREVRLLTPAGVDLSMSELGMATCRRPESILQDVMTVLHRAPCPHNALMGTGAATAQLRFDPELIYRGEARLSLYAGESVDDKPGLIVVADASRPLRAQLTYRGYLYVPPPEFGLGIALRVLPVPRPPFGAPLALSSFRLVVGAASLRYVKTSRGRRVVYRPRAIPLPLSCPARGFRFRAIVRLADGERLTDDAVVRCPSRHADR
jgi:hypothetical protein